MQRRIQLLLALLGKCAGHALQVSDGTLLRDHGLFRVEIGVLKRLLLLVLLVRDHIPVLVRRLHGALLRRLAKHTDLRRGLHAALGSCLGHSRRLLKLELSDLRLRCIFDHLAHELFGLLVCLFTVPLVLGPFVELVVRLCCASDELLKILRLELLGRVDEFVLSAIFGLVGVPATLLLGP